MKVGWEVTQGDFKGPDIIIFLTYFVLHIGIPTIIVQTHTNVYIHAHTCEDLRFHFPSLYSSNSTFP